LDLPLGGSFIGELARIWRANGIEVVEQRGLARNPDADLAILHINLTTIPKPYRDFLARYGRNLNGQVSDISKRRISRQLVHFGDCCDGPVIVKTNNNYFGLAEESLASRSFATKRLAAALRRRLPWAFTASLGKTGYRIFPSHRDVPWAVWCNPDLVVERFLPERSGEFYCVRTWLFFGDRESNSICYSEEPIVKGDNVVRRVPVPDIPQDLRRMRQELGFDFGKFDYAVVDGRTVLYDTNWTPTLGPFSRTEYEPRLRDFAGGIWAYLGAGGTPLVAAGGNP
jgi:hypothetical protein